MCLFYLRLCFWGRDEDVERRSRKEVECLAFALGEIVVGVGCGDEMKEDFQVPIHLPSKKSLTYI